MVLVMVSPQMGDILAKSACVTGGFPSQGNTWRFDTNSFDPYSVRIGLSHLLTAGVTVITVGTSAVAESIIYSVDLHTVGYIRCHRRNIRILTSDPEST